MKGLNKIVKLVTAVFLAGVITFMPGISDSNCAYAKAEPAQQTAEKEAVQKTGWFKKGKYKYYRLENGKLCTKKFVKINGKYYSFDAKGRLRTGLVTVSKDVKAYFSKKDGHFVNYVKEMVVVQKYKGSVTAKDSSGALFKLNLKKIVDETGKDIPESAIKKNSKIHVIYKKGAILETYPLQFGCSYKIKVLK